MKAIKVVLLVFALSLAFVVMQSPASNAQTQLRAPSGDGGRPTGPTGLTTGQDTTVGLHCTTPWGTCYYKQGSGVANCYPGANSGWLTANCENAGGTDTLDSNGKKVCSGMQNPC